MGKRLGRLFQSRSFKKAVVVVGMFFIVLTFVIYLDPEPFLQFGYLGVFVFNLFFGPGTLLLPLLATRMNIVAVALATASGMVLNDSLTWFVGRSGDVLIPRSKGVVAIERAVHKFGPLAVFLLCLIPMPQDPTGLVAGYLGLSYKRFVIPTFLGMFIRSLLIGYGSISLLGRIAL